MLDYICTFIGVYTDVLILGFFLAQYKIKRSTVGKFSLLFGFGLVNILMNFFEIIYIYKVGVSIGLCVIIIKVLNKDVVWYDALKCMIVFYSLLGIGELLIVPIMILFEGVYNIELFYSETLTTTWLFTLVLSRIITLVLIGIINRFWSDNGKKMTFTETVLINLPLLLAFFVAMIVEHYLINIEKFDMEDLTSVLVILAILLVAFTITYIKFLERNILAQKQEKEIIALEHNNELQYLFFEERNKHENEIKRIRHDLKNHLLLIKEKNIIQNSAYYDELLKNIEDDGTILSGCNVFDILVNEKKRIAENFGIDFKVLVIKDISSLNYLKERDLCSIFGNILDNAVENAMGVSNAFIDIKVDIINCFFYMSIENSFESEKIQKIDGEYRSIKPNQNDHGIGLESVNISLKKYNGYIKIENDREIFAVKIMIPLETCAK